MSPKTPNKPRPCAKWSRCLGDLVSDVTWTIVNLDNYTKRHSISLEWPGLPHSHHISKSVKHLQKPTQLLSRTWNNLLQFAFQSYSWQTGEIRERFAWCVCGVLCGCDWWEGCTLRCFTVSPKDSRHYRQNKAKSPLIHLHGLGFAEEIYRLTNTFIY